MEFKGVSLRRERNMAEKESSTKKDKQEDRDLEAGGM